MKPVFAPQWSPRPSWAQAPAVLLTWVESVLGGPVVAHRDVIGGFSSGLAARLRGADGRRLFVKAVCPALNPFAPAIHRREIVVGRGLAPLDLPVPTLRADYDDGNWVALAFDDIDGTTPPWPWRAADLAGALAVARGGLGRRPVRVG